MLNFFKRFCLVGKLLVAALLLASQSVFALQAIPPLSSPVTDLTQTLSPQAQSALAQKLTQFSQQTGSQIAVLIVDSTQPEDIAQYSIRLAEAWKIGRDKQDDGVIVLVAKGDRKMRIEVGYGLEGVIPDLIAKRIIDEVIKPHFKQGDFDGGLNLATDQLMTLIQGEQLPAPAPKSHQQDLMSLLPLLMFGAIILGMLLRSMFGTFLGSSLTGGLLGLLVWVLGSAIFVAALVALAGFIFTLAMSDRGGNGYSTGYGGPYSGGYGGLGGMGGRDIFSGGGGDFGGGGASGDW